MRVCVQAICSGSFFTFGTVFMKFRRRVRGLQEAANVSNLSLKNNNVDADDESILSNNILSMIATTCTLHVHVALVAS